MYETPTQFAQQATNSQQAENERRKRTQQNLANRGQYPYAAQGSQEAQQSGAAAEGAQMTNAQRGAKPQPQLTFAQMQQQGMARPAPPSPAPGTPQSAGMGQNGAAPLMQALTGMQAPAPQQLGGRPNRQEWEAGRQQWLAAGGAQMEANAPGPNTAYAGLKPGDQVPPAPNTQNGPQSPQIAPGTPLMSQPYPSTAQGPIVPQGGAQAPNAQGGAANLQQALAQMLANPSSYNTADVQRTYDTLGRQIDDQYNQQRTQVNEEMARRGIYDSTIAGGRLADTAIAQKSAKETLAQDLARQQAEKLDQSRQAALSLGLQNQGQQFSQQLGLGSQGIQRDSLAQQASQYAGDDAYRNKALDQSGSQFQQQFGETQRQFDKGQEFDYSSLDQSGMLQLMNMLGFDMTPYGGPGTAPSTIPAYGSGTMPVLY